MIIRKFVFVLSIVCIFLGLNACKSRGSSNQAQITTSDNSETSLDWVGTYSGITPCADCEGIETKISLNKDNTYQIIWKYIGKGNLSVNTGKFSWDSTGMFVILGNLDIDKYPTKYKVCENYLLQLDLEGNVITGEWADNYILKKD